MVPKRRETDLRKNAFFKLFVATNENSMIQKQNYNKLPPYKKEKINYIM